MKPFYECSELGRARRLRGLVEQALQHYDLEVTKIRLLSNDYNGVFRVDTTEGTPYAMRVCIPQEGLESTLALETAWLHALRDKAPFAVPAPVPTREGSFFTQVESSSVPEPRYCALFEWVKGKDLVVDFSEDNAVRYGALAAHLHELGATFPKPEGLDIRAYDTVGPFSEPWVLDEPEKRSIMPEELRDFIPVAVKHVSQHIERLLSSSQQMQVIHGDLHSYNVKAYRNKLAPIDFEDLMWGYPAQDLGIIFYYMWRREEYPMLRESFERGYRSVREWPEETPGEVDAFIAGRSLVLLNVLLQQKTQEIRDYLPGFMERMVEQLNALLPDKA